MRTTMMLAAMLAAQPAAAQEKEAKPLTTIQLVGKGQTIFGFGQLAFSTSGKQLVFSQVRIREAEQRITVYDSVTGKDLVHVSIQHPKSDFGKLQIRDAVPFVIGPRGDWVAYYQGSTIRFLVIPPHKPLLPKGAETKPVDPKQDEATSQGILALDPANDEFYFLGNGVNACFARRWKLDELGSTGHMAFTAEVAPFGAMTLAPELGRAVVSAGKGDNGKATLHCWTLEEKPTKTLIEQDIEVWSVAISPDGKHVASGRGDGSVTVHHIATGKRTHLTPELSNWAMGTITYHPGGRYLACGSLEGRGPNNFFLLDATTGKILKSLRPHAGAIYGICFDKAGNKLAVADHLGTVKIFDAADLLPLRKD